jgi:excisionase family DNA binding protein
MLTVPEAARRLGKNPETIRRWIRSGRLKSSKIGTQHTIEESDLTTATQSAMLPLPGYLKTTSYGDPMPDVVAWVRRSRDEH